jgi:hypothetical protein
MARRRGRKGRGRRTSKAIPILPVIGAIIPAYDAYKQVGFSKDLPARMLYVYTGASNTAPWNSDQALKAVALVVGGAIGHKVANKLGVNRYVKKATMGWLTL